ncbi:hypothetical protein GOODEAATRI_009636, partial [Goodea atripinnis]
DTMAENKYKYSFVCSCYKLTLEFISTSSANLFSDVFPLCPAVRYIGKSDSITISVWNHKKIHKKQGAGFLGCVRLLSNAINRLKDTGCKYPFHALSLLFSRPASEYSSPSGRPLSCVVDENTPVMTPVNGAVASGPSGEQRIQERRVRSQRHRNYMSRTHLHTPPDLPEGYGEKLTCSTKLITGLDFG